MNSARLSCLRKATLPARIDTVHLDSSGGKERSLGVSKRGDTYLRTLLIHGARSVLLHSKRRADHATGWLASLVARRNPNIAAVALANKNARIVWALLAHDRRYQHEYVRPQAA